MDTYWKLKIKMTDFLKRTKIGFKKYGSIFRISLVNILEYRINFFVGRIRNLIVLLTLYFLWHSIFPAQGKLFGYSQDQIFTYVFAIHLLRSLVLNTNTAGIAAEISYGGKFFSYLLKPISYLKYWFSVDLAYKLIDFSFALLEVFLVIYIFKISIYLAPDPSFWILAAISITFALLLNFYLGYFVALIAFWTPQAWGPRFLFDLLLSFSAGAFFPLDVFPKGAQIIFNALPFPYLLFFPVSIFLGRVSPIGIVTGFLITLSWIAILYFAIRYVWRKGLEIYEGGGI